WLAAAGEVVNSFEFEAPRGFVERPNVELFIGDGLSRVAAICRALGVERNGLPGNLAIKDHSHTHTASPRLGLAERARDFVVLLHELEYQDGLVVAIRAFEGVGTPFPRILQKA